MAYAWLARLDDAEGLAEKGLGDAVPSLRAAAAGLLADVLLRRAANDARDGVMRHRERHRARVARERRRGRARWCGVAMMWERSLR